MAQQVNILYLLLCHLNRYLWFEIPGLGVFNGTKSATHINHIDKKIYPGRLLIEFDAANTFRTEAMIQNMVAETGYDQELLEEHLAALCQTISESLKKNNSYEFVPFGTINEYGGKLFFNQSDNNIHQDFYWMEALEIIPVEQAYEKVILPVEPVIVSKTKSKKEFLFLLIALGILWSIFLSLLLCPPSSRIHTNENGGIQKDTTAIKDSAVSSTTLADTTQSLDSLINHSGDSLNSVMDSSGQFYNETVIDSVNINDLDKEIKYKPCVIIVGSFKKLSNAERLSKKVIGNGFELYRGEYGDFHRVGIKFNCFEHNLQNMLDELKEKFQPDAWVLMF